MVNLSQVKEHMEVVGSDGARIGMVDKVEGDRIKLTKDSSGAAHGDHHHYIAAASVASIEGGKVRLSSAGASAKQQEQEKGGERVSDKRH